jgi:hypothetical protein
VFEIAKIAAGYVSTLVSFNGTNGAAPYASLIAAAVATCSARRHQLRTTNDIGDRPPCPFAAVPPVASIYWRG